MTRHEPLMEEIRLKIFGSSNQRDSLKFKRVTGTPVYSRENSIEILGIPVKKIV